MTTIKKVIGREIIDSRGNPTLEVDVILDNEISENNTSKIFSGTVYYTHMTLQTKAYV